MPPIRESQLRIYFSYTLFFLLLRLQNLRLTYITRPARATFHFADCLPVRAEAVLSFRAPIKPAGEGVILLPCRLIVHFLAAQVAAGNRKLGRCLRGIHMTQPD